MSSKTKISRNSLCPCGSGKKYKKCCENKVNWEEIYSKNDSKISENLTLRGKNLWFYNIIADALQLDKLTQIDNKTIKKACTPAAVRKIHLALTEIWKDENDLERIFKAEYDTSSALYIGFYEPLPIIRGVTRHSLYSEKILLIDTFMDPRKIREQYNPIYHPEEHIENTLKDIRLWVTMYPWVEAGIVNFVKNPCDFDVKLNHECMISSRKKFDDNPELQESIDEMTPEFEEEMKEWHLLAYPDSKIRSSLKEMDKNLTAQEIEGIIDYVHKKRDEHPYFIPLIDEDNKKTRSSLLAIKAGANYEMAKLMASATNSHLITDMKYRWREIEMDHSKYSIKQEHWNSFSKAFQEVGVNFLNNVNLDDALQLRKENYLTDIRTFMSRIWRNCSSDKLFDEQNIKYLEDELKHHLKEAEVEWGNIEKKFFKNFGTATAAIVGSYPVIAKGSAEFLIGSLAISGLTNLGVLWHEKHSFPKKYPASFFLNINK